MFLFGTLTVALVLSGGPAPAGVFYEQETVSTVDGAEPGPPIVTRTWIAGQRMRMEAGAGPGGPAFVLWLDQSRAFRLFPAEKVVVELDVMKLKARTQMDASTAGALLGGLEDGEARTRELKSRPTVAGYPCRGFRVKAGSTAVDLFVSSEIGLGMADFEALIEWTGAAQGLGALLEEIRRLPGFPLQTRSRVQVLGRWHETTSTVTRVEVGAPDPSLFALPPDFRLLSEVELEAVAEPR